MTRSVIQILVSLLCGRNAQRITAAPACPFKHTIHYSFKYVFIIRYAYKTTKTAVTIRIFVCTEGTVIVLFFLCNYFFLYSFHDHISDLIECRLLCCNILISRTFFFFQLFDLIVMFFPFNFQVFIYFF